MKTIMILLVLFNIFCLSCKSEVEVLYNYKIRKLKNSKINLIIDCIGVEDYSNGTIEDINTLINGAEIKYLDIKTNKIKLNDLIFLLKKNKIMNLNLGSNDVKIVFTPAENLKWISALNNDHIGLVLFKLELNENFFEELSKKNILKIAIHNDVMNKKNINDKIFNIITKCKTIEAIHIHNSVITDDGLKYLSQIINCKSVVITNALIKGRGFKYLDDCELKEDPYYYDYFDFTDNIFNYEELKKIKLTTMKHILCEGDFCGLSLEHVEYLRKNNNIAISDVP